MKIFTLGLGITNFNSTEELKSTLIHLKKQKIQFDEIMILDDSSVYLNLKEIEQLIKDLKLKVRIEFNNENLGTFLNLKSGFEKMQTSHVTFMAAGDYLDPNYVHIIKSFYSNQQMYNKIAIPYKYEINSKFENIKIERPRFTHFYKLDTLLLHFINLSYDGGVIFPRKRILESGLFDWQVHLLMEDWYIWFFVHIKKINIKIIRKPLYLHSVTDNSHLPEAKIKRNAKGTNMILKRIISISKNNRGKALAKTKLLLLKNNNGLKSKNVLIHAIHYINMATLVRLQSIILKIENLIRYLNASIRNHSDD